MARRGGSLGGTDNRVPLLGGAYTARSVIADAQRCVNLYPEVNPKDAPTPVTHYLTPGLTTLAQPTNATVRGVFVASDTSVIGVIGANVYRFSSIWGSTLLGTIGAGTSQVSFADNGEIGVIADGTTTGYWFALGGVVLNTIVDAAYYGADYVCYLDGFFIWNRPVTNQFYTSPSFWNGTDALDPLDIASKIGGPDVIIAIAVINRELWLIGRVTSEVWYNAGGADFSFDRLPGVFLQHGMVRGRSLAQADVSLFWLGRDAQGECIVFEGKGYAATRISTHAIEVAIQGYAVVNDAIGFTYQQQGHTFYVLIFPTADKTWVYDLATKLWHERTWVDGNGAEHRIRANCCAAARDIVFVGDWQNGKIYEWGLDAFTDAGDAIVRRRSFPHIVASGRRVSYTKFQADVEVGAITGSPTSQDLMLRWSDTRGASWGDTVPITLDFGTTGQYDQSPTVYNLGMARDRVFELYWSFPYETALQGAWIETEPAET